LYYKALVREWKVHENMKYYYLDEDKEPVGPHTKEELIDLFSAQKILKNTLVAEEGGSEWIEFINLLNGKNKPFSEPLGDSSEPYNKYLTHSFISKDLYISFVYSYMLVTFFAALFELPIITGEEVALSMSNIVFLFIVVIVSTVAWAMLHFRCWSILPKQYRAGITPGQATGFMFIPIYNMFWVRKSYMVLERGVDNWSKTELQKSSITPNVSVRPIEAFIAHWILFIIILFFNPVLLSIASIAVSVMRCIFEIKMYKEIKVAINKIVGK